MSFLKIHSSHPLGVYELQDGELSGQGKINM